MKIYKSNYRYHWVSPYTILKAVCFWEKDDDVFYNHEDTPGHKYDKWVARLEPICKAWMKFLDFVHPKINYVKIDRYDTWSMDHTLADIILPMLKQLKTTKHGSPSVDDQDVPEGLGLRSTEAGPKENEWDTDDNWFKRWDWVLDEMIFAFEHKVDDSWQDAFRSGEFDHKTVACEWDKNGKATMYHWEDGPNHTYKCDYEGMKKVEERMQNGFALFGKYYQNLWD
jgi:hypothetical protein